MFNAFNDLFHQDFLQYYPRIVKKKYLNNPTNRF